MKNTSKLVITILLILSTVTAVYEIYSAVRAYTAPYPDGNINGYVAWGAGGPTDVVSRSLSAYAQEALGCSIIIQNKTGATGSVATEYVKRQPANGYSILFNSENPPLYKIMGISNIDYDDFYPVLIVGVQTAVLVTAPDSPFNTPEELFQSVLAEPGRITMATTGAGGLTSNVTAMMEGTSGTVFNCVPYDGDASVVTAVMGGYADVTIMNYSAARDYIKSGAVKAIAVFSDTRLESEPEVPTICEYYPEYERFFPWGTFVGVFVDDECPEEVCSILSEGFRAGFETEGFQQFLSTSYIQPLGIYGDEAADFLKQWQRTTTWMLYDAGQAAYSPEHFGIGRSEE